MLSLGSSSQRRVEHYCGGFIVRRCEEELLQHQEIPNEHLGQ